MNHTNFVKCSIAILTFIIPVFVNGQAGLTIQLKNGTESEQQAKSQLLRLLQSYEIDQWIYTDTVIIAEGERPHSHPVLTVNTKYLDQDIHQLSVFLHEQFHWLVYDHAQRDAVISSFKAGIEVPDWAREGTKFADSPYIHLVVCDLVYQAMTQLVGKSEAKQLMEAFRIESRYGQYRWVYDQLLTNKNIRKMNRRYGFSL